MSYARSCHLTLKSISGLESCSRALPPETSLSAVRWLMQAGKTRTISPTPAKAQRAKTAREAIKVIVDLANEYGYASEGESFSIADKDEAWVMDLIGKGPDNKGLFYVAIRIPDGYICAHANQARIQTFPQNDPENCIFSPEMSSECGLFSTRPRFQCSPISPFQIIRWMTMRHLAMRLSKP